MNGNKKKFSIDIKWVVGILIALIAAGGGFVAIVDKYEAHPVAKVAIIPNDLNIKVKTKLKLVINQFDQKGEPTNYPVQWSSNDLSVASVSNQGIVVANKVGSTQILSKVQDITSSITVNVIPNKIQKKFILKKGINKFGGWKHKGGDHDIFSKTGRTTFLRLKSTTRFSGNKIRVEVYFRIREDRKDHTEFYGKKTWSFTVPHGMVSKIEPGDIDYSKHEPGKIRKVRVPDQGFWSNIIIQADSKGKDHKVVGFSGNVRIPYWAEVDN